MSIVKQHICDYQLNKWIRHKDGLTDGISALAIVNDWLSKEQQYNRWNVATYFVMYQICRNSNRANFWGSHDRDD